MNRNILALNDFRGIGRPGSKGEVARARVVTRAAGFTLIELLTVLAITVIMIVFGIPSFASYLANQRASSASRDLMQDLVSARTESARTGLRASLAPKADADWSSGWEVGRVADQLDADAAAIKSDETTIGSSNVEIAVCAMGSGVANRIEFDSLGELVEPSGGARFTITAKVGSVSAAREVIVAPSGRAETVRISAEEASGACG